MYLKTWILSLLTKQNGGWRNEIEWPKRNQNQEMRKLRAWSFHWRRRADTPTSCPWVTTAYPVGSYEILAPRPLFRRVRLQFERSNIAKENTLTETNTRPQQSLYIWVYIRLDRTKQRWRKHEPTGSYDNGGVSSPVGATEPRGHQSFLRLTFL